MEESWSKMLAEGKRKYQLINVIAKRARMLNEGERATVPAEGMDPVRAALAELRSDKLRVTIRTDEEPQEGEEEEE